MSARAKPNGEVLVPVAAQFYGYDCRLNLAVFNVSWRARRLMLMEPSSRRSGEVAGMLVPSTL